VPSSVALRTSSVPVSFYRLKTPRTKQGFGRGITKAELVVVTSEYTKAMAISEKIVPADRN
jgi:hypothetical protein